MRLAVCDDERSFIDEFSSIMDQLKLKLNDIYNIDYFTEASELISELKNGEKYDLIFLDICMPVYTGLEIGKFIRDILKDDTCQLVFISSETQYALDLFKLRPMDFIIKPITKEKLSSVIEIAERLINNNHRFFEYSFNSMNFKIALSSIMYFSSEARKIVIHTKDENYEFYDNLKRIENELDKYNFFRIHQSFIVNAVYISRVKSNEIILLNNEVLPVSRSRKDEVKKLCFMNYL